MKKNFRIYPVLDVFIDVQADSKEQAIKQVEELIKTVMMETWQKLSELGLKDGCGTDNTFCTDSW